VTKLIRQQPSPQELADHAAQLARAFDIDWRSHALIKPDEACCVLGPNRRVVFSAPVTDETTYAVVLHELGHLASPMGAVTEREVEGGEAASIRRLCEAAAWAWARYYALIWTDVMEAVATYAEGTYAAGPAASPRKRIDWSQYR
jgi:hypothetical protein